MASMELSSDRIEISLRFLTSGRYVWTITGNFAKENIEAQCQLLKQIDGTLRELFPDHVIKGSGRTASFSEE